MKGKESGDIEEDLGPEDIDQRVKKEKEKKEKNFKETETRQAVEGHASYHHRCEVRPLSLSDRNKMLSGRNVQGTQFIGNIKDVSQELNRARFLISPEVFTKACSCELASAGFLLISNINIII